jgi:hypothetical protein
MLQGFLVFRVRFTREGSAMRFGISSLSIVLLSFAGVVAGTGCSSATYKEWKAHSSHFASGDHMAFSLKNQGKTPKVTSTDTREAAAQSWWGDPVVVRADQIFQN